MVGNPEYRFSYTRRQVQCRYDVLRRAMAMSDRKSIRFRIPISRRLGNAVQRPYGCFSTFPPPAGFRGGYQAFYEI